MLWHHVTKVVTKRGERLSKLKVRDWLISRGALPHNQAESRTVCVPVGDFTLRAPEELRHWLKHSLGCRTVEITEPPPPHQQRVAALGSKHKNVNHAPLQVRWIRLDDTHPTLTDLNVAQGATARIAVVVNQNILEPYEVELCYIEAKLGLRCATRSVWGTAYRYLPRIRLTSGADGIENPLRELEDGVLTFRCKDARWKVHWKYKLIQEFTVVGLETGSGNELLQATLLGKHGRILHRAVLPVSVGAPQQPVGAFAAFSMLSAQNFAERDEWFHRIQGASSTDVTAEEAKVGVCDTGIFDDANDGNYLKPRMLGAKYFHSIVNAGNDEDEADGDRDRVTEEDGDLLLEEPSKHGTNVAGQASYGATTIKLLDMMVQKGQTLGDITPTATARAFRWAASRGACVVNCSKILPFAAEEVNDVVNHDDVRDAVLFLATGSNEQCSFPFYWEEIRNAHIQRSTVGENEVPRNSHNTLWVGGCMQNGSKHGARGYGPGIDVMVPSDQAQLYTPRSLLEAFRLPQIERFRVALRARLTQRRQELATEPDMVDGKLSGVEQNMILPALEKDEKNNKLSTRDKKRLEALRLKAKPHANPKVALRGGYDETLALIAAWRWPVGGLVEGCATVLAWVQHLQELVRLLDLQTLDDVDVDNTWDDGVWARLAPVAKKHRATIRREIVDEMQVKGVVPTYDEVAGAQNNYLGVAGDKGVSFGLPVVANIAAKLKLLRKTMTANEMRRVLIDTSDYTPQFEGHCLARGIINPLRAYFAAYDHNVVEGGDDPRDGTSAASLQIEESRRLYYTVFYMDNEGLELYRATKDELTRTYAASNVDLIEAEPPIQIPSEIHTYVTNTPIKGWDWRRIVDTSHALTHSPKHIRIILASQSAAVLGSEIHNVTWDAGDENNAARWVAPNDISYKPPFGPEYNLQSTLVNIDQTLEHWKCRIALRDPGSRIVLPHRVDHIIEELKVGGVPTQKFSVQRVSDHRALVSIPTADNPSLPDHPALRIVVRVVQEIGGSRDRKNIFVNTNYLNGPNGTSAARRSTLVLLMHEIGHSLGMVPPEADAFYNSTFGGQGNHCGHNTANVDNGAARHHKIPGDGTGGQVKVPLALTDPDGHGNDVPCVMYHTRSDVHHRSKFCPACVDAIRDSNPDDWLR